MMVRSVVKKKILLLLELSFTGGVFFTFQGYMGKCGSGASCHLLEAGATGLSAWLPIFPTLRRLVDSVSGF